MATVELGQRAEIDVGHPVGVGRVKPAARDPVLDQLDPAPVGVSSPVSTHSISTGSGHDSEATNRSDHLTQVAGAEDEPAQPLGRVDTHPCHRIGRPPISTSALGIAWVRSWSLVPRPPHKTTTLPESCIGRIMNARRARWLSAGHGGKDLDLVAVGDLGLEPVLERMSSPPT